MFVSYNKEYNPSELPLTNLQFCLKLTQAMTKPLVESRVIPSHAPVSEEKRLIGKHFPYHSDKRSVRIRRLHQMTKVIEVLKLIYGVQNAKSIYA